jgi:hypothetical protein
MASIKREIVLGCFAVLCTVLFIIFNPNRHQLMREDGVFLRMDGLTGKVTAYVEPGSHMTDKYSSHGWWNFPETKFPDK